MSFKYSNFCHSLRIDSNFHYPKFWMFMILIKSNMSLLKLLNLNYNSKRLKCANIHIFECLRFDSKWFEWIQKIHYSNFRVSVSRFVLIRIYLKLIHKEYYFHCNNYLYSIISTK